MNFNEFVNEVKDNIRLFLPKDYENAEVSTMECQKLNRAYTGLMVRKEGEMLTPTINLNQLYEAYKAQPGVTMETVCRKIADIVIEAPIQVDLKAILNYEICDSSILENIINKIDDLELNAISKSSISPLGYGTFYNVGTYNQDLLFSLAAGSVSLIFALATKGVSVLFITKENVKKFIKYILGYTVKTQFYSTTYVKREQAVLNSHGTTTEKRTLGAKLPGKSSITWDTSCYKFTFETQRPA